MGLFEHWPYVNFHDLNLDWIIKEIPKVYASRDEAQASAEASAESAAASQLSAEASQASADTSQLSAEASQQSAEASQQSAEASAESAEDAAETVENTLNQIAVLQGRVDNIIPSGTQTEGNTELLDIRVGADGYIYLSAGDAVRNQSAHLYDYMYGAVHSFNGQTGQVNKFPLLLINGKSYTVTNNTGDTTNVILFKADDTQYVVTGNLANNASITFTVPGNDYVKIGGFFNANSTGLYVVTSHFSSLMNLTELEAGINSNAEDITDISRELDDFIDIKDVTITELTEKHANQFYNVNNQVYDNNQWDWYEYAVNPGDIFTIDTVAGGTVRAWAFRDENQAQLSIESYNGEVTQREYTNITAPENAVQLIVNYKHTEGYLTITKNNAVMIKPDSIQYNNKFLPEYLDDIVNAAAAKSNILHGKVLCCCGDSITYGADLTGDALVTPDIESYQYSAYTKQWTRWTDSEPASYGYQIASRNNMIFYNGGVSGACVQGSGGSSEVPGFSEADGEYTLLPENIDYLTLFYGWNDTAYGSLGTINDSTNDSYYGAYNVVLPYLLNKYPYTKIALIVPFGTDVGHRQAIRNLADKWGLACFDMMQGGTPLYYNKEPDVDVDPAIVTSNRAKYQANGAHPNIQGHFQISTMLEHFLRGI